MQWGILNLWKEADEGAYAVRHGKDAVNDFGQPRKGDNWNKFFEKAFPLLFPNGRGGLECFHPNPIDFGDQIKWALRYHDGRFRRHETFSFTAFGILQRRQALGASRLQTRRQNFERDAHILSSITVEKLKAAQEQEEKGERVTDSAILLLKSHVHAAAGKVMGSNASKYRLKSQIWSTSIALGPPSLWLTINPSQNVAGDSYASAKFFHFTIQAVLKTLFGVQKSHYQLHSEKGIFGYVSAYFGSIEN
ncbi:hypothetical protein C8R42DRAFT_693122 [Lentinula raphanica]|nr:hypothetical protein C8R42DRAFT_693122 [Lentinula raphanica]